MKELLKSWMDPMVIYQQQYKTRISSQLMKGKQLIKQENVLDKCYENLQTKLETLKKYLNVQYDLSKFAFNNIKIYPEKKKVFNCFNCDFKSLKVVFIGKKPFDEYSEGLAFDTDDKKIRLHPVSELIRTTIEQQFHNGFCLDYDNTLNYLMEQGVLLLNESLTSCTNKDHFELWKPFITDVINTIQYHHAGIIFCICEDSEYIDLIDTKLQHLLTFKNPEDYITKPGEWGFDFTQINGILTYTNGEEYNIKW